MYTFEDIFSSYVFLNVGIVFVVHADGCIILSWAGKTLAAFVLQNVIFVFGGRLQYVAKITIRVQVFFII